MSTPSAAAPRSSPSGPADLPRAPAPAGGRASPAKKRPSAAAGARLPVCPGRADARPPLRPPAGRERTTPSGTRSCCTRATSTPCPGHAALVPGRAPRAPSSPSSRPAAPTRTTSSPTPRSSGHESWLIVPIYATLHEYPRSIHLAPRVSSPRLPGRRQHRGRAAHPPVPGLRRSRAKQNRHRGLHRLRPPGFRFQHPRVHQNRGCPSRRRVRRGLLAAGAGREAVETLSKRKGCKAYRDFRELLADPDIDAVMISTPDHWHVPMAIAAVRAGKDVALEKPITRYIDEGRLLADAVAKHKRVFRVDSEFRSLEPLHRAAELVRNGRIGKLHAVRTGSPQEVFPDEPETVTAPPPELDYDLWLGPAPKVDYMQKRVHTPHDLQEPSRLDAQPRLLRRHDHQLGHAPQRHRPVGRRHRAHRPGRDQGHRQVPRRQGLERAGEVRRLVQVRQRHGAVLPDGQAARALRGRARLDPGQLSPTSSIQASDPAILKEKIGPDEIHFPLQSEKQDFIDAVQARAAGRWRTRKSASAPPRSAISRTSRSSSAA